MFHVLAAVRDMGSDCVGIARREGGLEAVSVRGRGVRSNAAAGRLGSPAP
jgi:hypothetical protein